MNIKQYILILLLLSPISILLARRTDTLTLSTCLRRAVEQHPLDRQYTLHQKTYQLKKKNANTNWLPALDINASASYQSDVPSIGEVEIPVQSPQPGAPESMSMDIPEPSKDQYQITLDVKQTIYDAGATRKNKKLADFKQQVNKQETRVNIHKVKEKVADVYFSVMLLDKKHELMHLTKKEINKRKKTIQSGIENGTVLPSARKSLDAERLKLEQQMLENRQQRNAMITVLEELTDTTLEAPLSMAKPGMPFQSSDSIHRPEIKLFEKQTASLEASQALTKTRRFPKVFAFSQLGYGKPGLNMLSDDFDSWYLIGAGLKWDLWDWNQNKRKRQIMEVRQSLIQTRKNHFKEQVHIALQKQLEQINNYRELIKTDHKIIKAREKVTQSARSQLNNGVINATEYINELNTEKKAKISLETHKIQLMKAKIQYLILNGEM